MRTPDGAEWLPVIEAASRLGIKRARIDQWVSRKRIRSIRVRGRRYVCFQDVVFMERCGRER